ncbi:hypothetical protein PR048_010564 [Dryococelus australis]|uniref:Uncharacterized protein n=1 Tax=Dryococelus australis TaxID=614101 RepID=A0ABQ9I463_9NEOP|nr:hypothetical protein PR048_010564 [Dryococelus australis]
MPADSLPALPANCGRAGMKGRGKREIPEKTHRPVISSGTIPIYGNPGVTWLEIEPGNNITPTTTFASNKRAHGGVVVRLLASHLGEPSSISGFPLVGLVLDDAAGKWVFSEISRFPRPFIPALLQAHLTSPSSALKTSMSGEIWGGEIWVAVVGKCRFRHNGIWDRIRIMGSRHILAALNSEVLRADEGNCGEYGERRNERAWKREIPEKTRRPTTWSGTIPTCENPLGHRGPYSHVVWNVFYSITYELRNTHQVLPRPALQHNSRSVKWSGEI